MVAKIGRNSTAMEALRGASLAGRTAIVTGGNQGLGKETVRALASAGCRVILTCRNLQVGTAAIAELRQDPAVKQGNGDMVAKLLDLADLESVSAFAKDFLSAEPRLDLLVCNAGIMQCPKGTTKNGFELQIGTNHHGHFQLVNLLLDKMKATEGTSRIVVVSSSLHSKGRVSKQMDDLHFRQTKYDKMVAYGNSKSANVLFVRELSRRLQGTSVQAYALEPGVIPTQLSRHLGAIGAVFRAGLGRLLFPSAWKSAPQGAATQVFASVAPELEAQPGAYLKNCAVHPLSHRECLDDAVAARLWAVTEEDIQKALGPLASAN